MRRRILPSDTRWATSVRSFSWTTDPKKSLKSASISEVGIIEYRLKDWLQSVKQCLLAYAIIDRRNAQYAPLTWFARLWDALLPHRLGDVLVSAKLFVQSGETLFEPFAKCLDAFTVNPTGPVIGFDTLPRDLQVLPFVALVDERVNLPRPRRIDPVCESPRSVMFGSFTEGTVHLTGLTHLAFCLSPTVFAGRLPRHTLSPGSWSRGFRRASGTIRPSDYSQDTASHFARAYRVTSLGATRGS